MYEKSKMRASGRRFQIKVTRISVVKMGAEIYLVRVLRKSYRFKISDSKFKMSPPFIIYNAAARGATAVTAQLWRVFPPLFVCPARLCIIRYVL